MKHPGVKKENKKSEFRIGGRTELLDKGLLKEEGVLNPKKIKEYFKKRGWESIVGFQTRNVVHRAHEYLQRVALEICDGLFINPLVGWKKDGDFSEEAVITGYKIMLKYSNNGLNVYLKTLKTVYS